MTSFKGFLKSKKGLTFAALLLALAIGIAIGTVVSDGVLSAEQRDQVALLTINNDGNTQLLDRVSLADGFSAIAQSVQPAVVNISTSAVVRQRAAPRRPPEDPFHEFFGEEFFERFFGPNVPREREVNSLGSGVIVDSKGYILTNHHVIQRADKIDVRLSSGENYPARVVGFDRESDVAVLKVDAPRPLPFAEIGDTSSMRVGDWVLAIGSPFGLDHTVTSGIISATGRVGIVDQQSGQIRPFTNIYGDYVQTDAAINPGNSGGPLVNMKGEVIGINTFISTRSGGSVGVGFAIPSTVFVNSYNQLVSKGKIERGWLGVSMNTFPLTPEMASFFGVAGNDPDGVKDGRGVLITQLIDEKGDPADTGPAYKAGIRPEDVIVKFADRKINNLYDLRSAVANTPPGQTVPVVVVRHGRVLNLNVTLAERTFGTEPERERMTLDECRDERRPKEIGLEFETLDARDAQSMGLEGERGVRIREVTPGSLADDAGLQANQVITHVNGQPVRTSLELKNTITGLQSGAGVVLRVVGVDEVRGQRQKSVFFTSFVKP
jgi:serine protease Do